MLRVLMLLTFSLLTIHLCIFSQNPVYNVSVHHKDDNIHHLDQITKNYKLLPLQLNDGDFFAEMSKVVTHQDRIYVLDFETSRLFQFTRDGKFIRNIGKIGEGYDEYRDIRDFDIDSEGNIFILSNRSWAYYKYSPDGQFIQKVSSGSTAVTSIGILDQNNVICASNHFDEDYHNVLVLDKNGKIRKKLHPYPKGVYEMSFGYTGGMIRSGDQILYTEPASCKIYALKIKNGEVFSNLAFEVDLGKHMWKCEDHTDVNAFWKVVSKIPDDLSYLRNKYSLTDRHLLFSYNLGNRLKNALFNTSSKKMVDLHELTPGLLQNAIKYNPVKGVDEQHFVFSIDEDLWFYLKKESEKLKNTEKIDEQFWKVIKDIRGDGNDPPYLLFVEFR